MIRCSIVYILIALDVKGSYLMRHEIIALHVALTLGGAEFYPSCFQLQITGATSNSLVKDVPGADLAVFPGSYKATDPGILVPTVYNPGFDYSGLFPGPAIPSNLSPGGGGGNSPWTPTPAPAPTPTPTPVSEHLKCTPSPASAYPPGDDGQKTLVLTLTIILPRYSSPTPQLLHRSNRVHVEV